MFEEVDKTNRRIKKAEDVELQKINRSLGVNLSAIEREVSRNWERIRQQELLPDEKANALFGRIEKKIRNNDYSEVLRKLYDRARAEGVSLNQQWLGGNIETADNLNEPVDFWVLDGNNRIGDWTRKFIQNVQGTIRLGFQSRWGKDQVISAIRTAYGQLKLEVDRVVRTGSTGVISGVSDRLAVANKRNLVVFKTSEDDRVCPYCAAREGNVYRRGEISLGLHPWCRCALLPISEARLRDEGFRKSLKAIRKESSQLLEQSGGKPNKGVAPFEKRPGVKNQKPPRPVFDADRGFTWGERKRIFEK